ncbi:hypothetical protein [Nocardia sp. CA-290969]|uniref:hypothetical protein n=1 Tax=Nocardia sp. CA-290969 TaxID=3239986 RepID=UPI003D9227DE
MNDRTDGPPSEHEQLAPALALVEDLRLMTNFDDLELLVPEGMLVGMTRAYGVPVRHIPGIDCVYVGKRAEIRQERLL